MGGWNAVNRHFSRIFTQVLTLLIYFMSIFFHNVFCIRCVSLSFMYFKFEKRDGEWVIIGKHYLRVFDALFINFLKWKMCEALQVNAFDEQCNNFLIFSKIHLPFRFLRWKWKWIKYTCGFIRYFLATETFLIKMNTK